MKPFPFDPAQHPDEDAWTEENCWSHFPFDEAHEMHEPENGHGFRQNMGGSYICCRCGELVERENYKPERPYYPFCSKPCQNSQERKHAMKLKDYFKHGVQVRLEISNLPNDKKLIGTISQGEPLNALVVLNEDLDCLFSKIRAELKTLVDEVVGDKLLLCDGGGKIEVHWEDGA